MYYKIRHFQKRYKTKLNNLSSDPPSLKIKHNGQCNSSSSVDITCDSLGGSVNYDDWFHFYNGILIKKIKAKTLGNRSTISIETCGIEDSGDYMCKAGYAIANKTFWTNVTTNLKFQGNDEYLHRKYNLIMKIMCFKLQY